MTAGRPARNQPTLRRRLIPAAQLFLLAAAAILLLAGSAPTGGKRQDEPRPSRPLPDAALAGEVAGPASPPPTVDEVERDVARPRRITIPAIDVSAVVVPLGLAADGTMETPRSFTAAGWFEPGPEPGERGPAVLAGHVDSVSGPAVFYRLRELRRGNLIRIGRPDGTAVRFRVEGLERWPKASFPTDRVFGQTAVATLRLVTCSGDFDSSTGHYLDNTIVYATRVGAPAQH